MLIKISGLYSKYTKLQNSMNYDIKILKIIFIKYGAKITQFIKFNNPEFSFI